MDLDKQKIEREMKRYAQKTTSLMEKCSFLKFKDVGEVDLEDILSEDSSKIEMLYKKKQLGFKYEISETGEKPSSSESLISLKLQKQICEYMNTRISGEHTRLNGKGSMNSTIQKEICELKKPLENFFNNVESIKNNVAYLSESSEIEPLEFNRRKCDVANTTFNLEDALNNKEGRFSEKTIRMESKSIKKDAESARMRSSLSEESSLEKNEIPKNNEISKKNKNRF